MAESLFHIRHCQINSSSSSASIGVWIHQHLVAPEAFVVGGIGSQPALRAELTTVPYLMESPDAHGVGLKQFLDDVPFRVVEVAEEIGLRQCCQVAHAVDDE